MKAEAWRRVAFYAAAITLIYGVFWACYGGPVWPSTVGAVATCVLGEVWRWQLRRLRR